MLYFKLNIHSSMAITARPFYFLFFENFQFLHFLVLASSAKAKTCSDLDLFDQLNLRFLQWRPGTTTLPSYELHPIHQTRPNFASRTTQASTGWIALAVRSNRKAIIALRSCTGSMAVYTPPTTSYSPWIKQELWLSGFKHLCRVANSTTFNLIWQAGDSVWKNTPSDTQLLGQIFKPSKWTTLHLFTTIPSTTFVRSKVMRFAYFPSPFVFSVCVYSNSLLINRLAKRNK